jgi:hypothetical protein
MHSSSKTYCEKSNSTFFFQPQKAPSDLFIFPRMKINLKDPKFVTIEDICAKSQMLLNMLMKKSFHDALLHGRGTGSNVQTCKRNTLKVKVVENNIQVHLNGRQEI